jgi:hypothetical protein
MCAPTLAGLVMISKSRSCDGDDDDDDVQVPCLINLQFLSFSPLWRPASPLAPQLV